MSDGSVFVPDPTQDGAISGKLVTGHKVYPNTTAGEAAFENRPDWAQMRDVTRWLALRPLGH